MTVALPLSADKVTISGFDLRVFGASFSYFELLAAGDFALQMILDVSKRILSVSNFGSCLIYD